MILKQVIEDFRNGEELIAEHAEPLLDALISETDEAILGATLRSWNNKGITESEIFYFASILRGRCTRVSTRHETFVDIVGTGGSRSKTFNVSTAASFVIAGAGIPVAKHGNRAATSLSGSADVLAELGVEPAVDADTASRCLDDIGICFMFAPNFHRLSPTLGKVRRELGFPTIFNCVGPLCNPAAAPHQLIGVWDQDLVGHMAGALDRLGTKKSWIVHSESGLDEVSLEGITRVAEVSVVDVREFDISPRDFGIDPASADGLAVSSRRESANVIISVLEQRHPRSAAERLVLLNAAAAIFVADGAASLNDSFALAERSLRDGHALGKLRMLAEAVKG